MTTTEIGKPKLRARSIRNLTAAELRVALGGYLYKVGERQTEPGPTTARSPD